MSHEQLDTVVAVTLLAPVFGWPLLLLFANYVVAAGEVAAEKWVPKNKVKKHKTPKRAVEIKSVILQGKEEFCVLLHNQLVSLSVRAYERLIADLLRSAGYEEVRILRDHHVKRRSHKGRTAHGGVDIMATSRSALQTVPILVQVKQYERPVSRRFVDELRGALLRTQARHALLITTSTFPPAAWRAAREDHVGPIQLIDGVHLQELLLCHQLGVRRIGRSRWVLNPKYFESLESQTLESQMLESRTLRSRTPSRNHREPEVS